MRSGLKNASSNPPYLIELKYMRLRREARHHIFVNRFQIIHLNKNVMKKTLCFDFEGYHNKIRVLSKVISQSKKLRHPLPPPFSHRYGNEW